MNQPATPNSLIEARMTIDEAREYLVEYMMANFSDKTFHRYIRGERGSVNLAGDFAWQMATALKADRAQRPSSLAPTVVGSVDTPEFRALFRGLIAPDGEVWPQIIAHINALIAPAAPSGEAVAYADPMAFLNFKAGVCTNEWMWAKPDSGLVPIYTHPAPSSPTAPVQQAQAVPEGLVQRLRDMAEEGIWASELNQAANEIERLAAEASANTPEGK